MWENPAAHKPVWVQKLILTALMWFTTLPIYITAQNTRLVIQLRPVQGGTCTGTFIEHPLPHSTTTRNPTVRFYESNGAGLAINDLNDDGLLDIVLANLHGRNTILWNTGDLQFESQHLNDSQSRAVSIVDVDGDDRLDIVFTHSVRPPTYWYNLGTSDDGRASFHRERLNNVTRPAYSLVWGDPDNDTDLDLIIGSYDSELEKELGNTFLFSDGAGVFYYEHENDEFSPTRLAERSHALALWLSDLNADGSPELIVGNDFSMPDQEWSYVDARWQETPLFHKTTFSTMSFDAADINNDGDFEFFAADMKPDRSSPEVLEAMQPVLSKLARVPRLPGDRQIIANVFQVSAPDGFDDRAPAFGIDATGWSWSAKFGDLDQDGFLDLYVVNGMIAQDIFHHLPNAELVEPNAAYRNQSGARFQLMPDWNLGSLDSGRGMSMADLDNDGDLDIVVNNLNTPSELFENQLCGGDSLQVEMRWPIYRNTRAVGAIVVLYTDHGTYLRDVRTVSGYLSGDPARVHFGFPAHSELMRLEVRWPDGLVSDIPSVTANSLITLIRSE